MQKVLCLLPDYEGNGGIHRFNRNLVKAIRQQPGCQCEVLTLNDTGSTEIYRGFGQKKGAFMLAALRATWRFKPDVIIVGLLNFAPLAFLKKLHNCRVVTILHGFEAWYRRKNLSPFYRWVDTFWAVSEYTRRVFAETNGVALRRVEKIFNTIPADWDQSDAPVEYRPFFLSVTRLDKGEMYKGIDKTIAAIGQLQDEMRAAGWEFRLVAYGNDVDRHRQLVEQHGVNDLVKFQSNLTDRELQDLYAGCSFFNLPSSGEGFGIVFLEAMAYKKACIGASDCGTEDVIVHEETGFLIEPTVKNIAGCLHQLVTNSQLCREMGEAGYERLHTTFSFQNFQQKIGSLLQLKTNFKQLHNTSTL
jgi:phosphatidyl-myo-inositol dimannoside synthase